jgi:hypothetical protein
MTIEWRTCIQDDNYAVSNTGVVKRIVGGQGTFSGRILRPKKSKKAKFWYFRVALTRNNVSVDYNVHALVCAAFHGPAPTEKHQVAHGDGNPFNNNEANLRWATCAENQADKSIHGTLVQGMACHNSKLTEKDVACIRRWAKAWISQSELARAFGVYQGHISAIVRGRKRKAGLSDTVSVNG